MFISVIILGGYWQSQTSILFMNVCYVRQSPTTRVDMKAYKM